MSAASASPSPDSGLPALPAALPMQTGLASPLATAPPVAALPIRRYVGYARPARDRDAYAYLDRASDVQDEIGDAPPDYDYRNDDGAVPYVWETSGGDYRYAERGPDGYRYYYYQPGAREPYLVRTHDYSYAYAAGALVAVFALSGALLSHDHYDSYRDDASRYYWRGDSLRQFGDERPHEGVRAADWSEQRPQFSAEREYWAAARQRQPDWQAYHAQNDPSRQPGWQQEYQQRQHVAQQFSSWQQRGLQGPPPPALSAPGARAGSGYRQPDNGQRQPYGGGQNGANGGGFGQPGVAGQNPGQFRNGAGRDMGRPAGGYAPGGQNPNAAAPETATRDRQLAAQQEARQQARANQQRAQQAKVAQHEADARQQMANQTQHQQDVAAQQVRAREAQQRDVQHRELQQQEAQQRNGQQHELQQREAQKRETQQRETQQRDMQQRELQQHEAQQREAQQREAQASAHQAQMRDLAAQRQEETARSQERQVQAQEHAQQAAAHEHAAQVERSAQERPPAPRPEAPRPEPVRGEQGHENDRHN